MNIERRRHKRSIFGREERWFLFKVSLLVVFVYYFRREIFLYGPDLMLALPMVLAIALLLKVFTSNERLRDLISEQVTLVPIFRAEGGEKMFIPWATIFLILINVTVHYFLKTLSTIEADRIVANLTFLPHTMTWWNGWISPITSIFLHANDSHLWGNMLFLWAFCPAVEERIGVKSFILLYLLTGLIGGLAAAFVYLNILKDSYCSLGASGAISGIMGIFMVRCYFKKLIIPLPLFWHLNYKLRVNSLIPLGYFFLIDASGGARQLAGIKLITNYWAHIGSLIAGVLLAFIFKQHSAASGEKYTAIATDALEDPNFDQSGEEALCYSLEIDSNNEVALLALARKKARARLPEGKELFARGIRLKLRSSPKQAAELYKECLAAYNQILSPSLQYKMAGILYREGDLDSAMRALEMIVDGTGAGAFMRERAYSQLVDMLAAAGLHGPARHRLEQFAAAFPGSKLLQAAQRKFPIQD